MSTVFHSILRAVASAMEIPVTVCLLLVLAFAAFSIGWVLTERLGERRHLSVSLPALLDRLRSGEEPIPDCIAHSGVVSGGGESLEKRGEVFYDTETGTYYIIQDSQRSSGGNG